MFKGIMAYSDFDPTAYTVLVNNAPRTVASLNSSEVTAALRQALNRVEDCGNVAHSIYSDVEAWREGGVIDPAEKGVEVELMVEDSGPYNLLDNDGNIIELSNMNDSDKVGALCETLHLLETLKARQILLATELSTAISL